MLCYWHGVLTLIIQPREKETEMSSMEELLAEYSEPVTEGEYRNRLENLLLAFGQRHGLFTYGEIEKAIRTHSIEESMLVEEWLELRAFEPVKKRQQKRREQAAADDQGRVRGPFLFRNLKPLLVRAYTRFW